MNRAPHLVRPIGHKMNLRQEQWVRASCGRLYFTYSIALTNEQTHIYSAMTFVKEGE